MQLPDAEALYLTLRDQLEPQITDRTAMVGIHTGGYWLAERLHRDLKLRQPLGAVDVSFYRDDYGSRGLHAQLRRSEISFDVEQADIILLDDVLYTGRTVRAALNELFDYGRPGRIQLAVLIDRGERQLPIAPDYAALVLEQPLEGAQMLELRRDAHDRLTLERVDG